MAASLNGMNREELTELVRYHIVPSRVTGGQLRNDLRLTTLSSSDKQLRVKRYHSVCCMHTPSFLTITAEWNLARELGFKLNYSTVALILPISDLYRCVWSGITGR